MSERGSYPEVYMSGLLSTTPRQLRILPGYVSLRKIAVSEQGAQLPDLCKAATRQVNNNDVPPNEQRPFQAGKDSYCRCRNCG